MAKGLPIGFSATKTNVFWCKMCVLTPEQKQQTLWKWWVKQSVIIHSAMSRVWLQVKRPVWEEKATTEDPHQYLLQICL